MGLRVVAEGVEDAHQLRALEALGCDLAQGFHFSRPVPKEELGALLAMEPVEAAVSQEPS
jgi:EAL domain-containing protein (putative c-di-GMP-specific phosphodiesterase class I)